MALSSTIAYHQTKGGCIAGNRAIQSGHGISATAYRSCEEPCGG
jgi:hypothetical protein